MWASSAHVQLSPETLQLKRSIRDTNFVAKHHMRKIMCFWKIRACKPDNKRILTSLIITNLLLCLHVTVCFSLCASQADQTKLVLVWINKAAWIWTSIISCNKKNIYLHFQLFSSRLFVCLFVCLFDYVSCLFVVITSSSVCRSQDIWTWCAWRQQRLVPERDARRWASSYVFSDQSCRPAAGAAARTRWRGSNEPRPQVIDAERWVCDKPRIWFYFFLYIWSCKYVDVCVMIGGRRCFRAVSQAMCCSPPPSGSVVVSGIYGAGWFCLNVHCVVK